MSQNFWAVSGYGINLEEITDCISIGHEMPLGNKSEDWMETIESIAFFGEGPDSKVKIEETKSADNGTFALILDIPMVALDPYKPSDNGEPKEFKQLTQGEAREYVYEFLKPYLVEGTTKEEILSRCKQVSTYGWE